MKRNIPELVIEHARIIFRNFSGKEGKFNPAGRRNFSVILDPNDAERLAAEGWNVKALKPRDPEDPPTMTLPVAVSYDYYPPKIFLISDGNKTELDEELVDQLDYAEFDMVEDPESGEMVPAVDLVIRPYQYEVSGREGVKAYLKKGYFTIRQDALDRKYRDMSDEDMPF